MSMTRIIRECGLATDTANCARSLQIIFDTWSSFSAAESVQLGLHTFSMQPTSRSM